MGENFNEVKERIEREAPELIGPGGMSPNAAAGAVSDFMDRYDYTFEGAVTEFRARNNIPEPEEEYERVEEWDGTSPPPKVPEDHWVDFGPSDGKLRLFSWASEMEITRRSIVYILKLRLRGQSLQEVEQQANVILSEVPTWLDSAWSADHVYYVGQTRNFGKRLKTHATGTFDDYPGPAHLTVLSDVVGAGVVKNCQSIESAEEFEDTYGRNLRDITDDGVFVYHA